MLPRQRMVTAQTAQINLPMTIYPGMTTGNLTAQRPLPRLRHRLAPKANAGVVLLLVPLVMHLVGPLVCLLVHPAAK
jgi:hypothetical protein